jgi:hypothetical protein
MPLASIAVVTLLARPLHYLYGINANNRDVPWARERGRADNIESGSFVLPYSYTPEGVSATPSGNTPLPLSFSVILLNMRARRCTIGAQHAIESVARRPSRERQPALPCKCVPSVAEPLHDRPILTIPLRLVCRISKE